MFLSRTRPFVRVCRRRFATSYWRQPRRGAPTACQGYSVLGEVLYGADPVLAALRAGKRDFFHRLFVLESGSNREIDNSSKSSEARESALQLAQQLQIPVERCNRNFLDELSGRRPSNGLALDAAPLHPGVVSTLQLPAESAGDVDTQRTPRVWVALDQVVDPQNLGAILRSALFFGVEGVVVCRRNSAPLSPIVAKASCGALEYTDIRFCTSMPRFLKSCRESWEVVGMSAGQSAVNIRELTSSHKFTNILLVLGNEGFGLRTLVQENCKYLAKLEAKNPIVPTSLHPIDSLNVSTAVGVTLFHLLG